MIKNQCIINGLLQSVEIALMYDPVRRLEYQTEYFILTMDFSWFIERK